MGTAIPEDKELEIRRQFLDEAQEYLDTLDSTLFALVDRPIDVQNINAALRVAHSIKGGAGMMGFTVLSDLAHRFEDALKVLKLQPTMLVDSALETLLLAAIAALHQVVAASRQTFELDIHWLMTDIEPIFVQLRSQLGDPQEETAASVLLPEDGQDIIPLIFETEVEGCLQRLEAVLATPDQPCLREEVLILAQELGGLGEMLQLPAFSRLCGQVEQVLAQREDISAVATLALKTWRQSQSVILAGRYEDIPTALEIDVPKRETAGKSAPRPSTPPTDESKADATVRVPVRDLNFLNDWFGELVIDRNGLDLYLKRLRTLTRLMSQRVRQLELVNSKVRATYDRAAILSSDLRLLPARAFSSPSSSFDELEFDRYDDLHSLSQQIMEAIAQLQEVSDDVNLSLDDVEQVSRSLKKTTKQLQGGLTRLRMRPFSDIVDRFPRALRDWSMQYGKQVQFQVSGGALLIDRNILEALQDPLMHLLRNAFDHGIEDPEQRVLNGKPAEGIITIEAIQKGNRIMITIQDDGKGISVDKIRDRAEQLGLDATLLAMASETDLLSLIFEPGFSTSDELTTLSGRGVGMDVVRSNLKRVRGDISVNTEVNRGTTFTLSVPATLLTVRILLIEIRGILLAIPTDAIAELALAPENLAQEREFYHQGKVIPLLPIQRWLTFNSPRSPHQFETPPTVDRSSVLILNQNQQQVGLRIDRCWTEQEATVRSVEGTLPMPHGFSGCSILSDGRVVPLVNLAELIQWVNAYDSAAPRLMMLSQQERSQPLPLTAHQPHQLLIVDDSINVRRFLAVTLERAGYRVEQAKDGQEAIERLEEGLAVNAIICDVEMPRLDGYGFLSKIKADPILNHIPVAMLTSRSGDKHRQLAMQLGASAFFPKPYNEQVLLQTLEELVVS
jgi:two-component system, chemotaxis family, sensor histidine kinase and response regulator PixL